MDWSQQVDGYCERLGPGLWAEPLNAVTNLAFLGVALWVWPRASGIERVLAAVLFAIGIGSGLFHTFATRWAGLADTLPILGFILVYVVAANRRFLMLPWWIAILGSLVVLPYAALIGRVFAALPGFSISAPYWPVPVLIAGYGVYLRHRLPRVATGLAAGAGMLAVSLVFRSLDMALCPVWPVGTHFLWHLMNAAMLGWMIVVLRGHRLRRQAGAGVNGKPPAQAPT